MLKSLILTIITVVVCSTTVFSFNGYENYILKFNPKVTKSDVYKIGQSTFDAGSTYNFDPVLILALMKVESTFDRYAYNSMDARGLMQIRVPIWFKTLKKEGLMDHWRDFYDPERNIHSGVYILFTYRKICEEAENKLKCTLQRYNGAPTGNKYYIKVMKSIQQYHKLNELKLAFSENINTIEFGDVLASTFFNNIYRHAVVDLNGPLKNSIKQYLQTTQIIVLM